MSTHQLNVSSPAGVEVGARTRLRMHTPRAGVFVLLCFCGLELLDWWTPSNITESIHDPARLIPHICRTAVLIWLAVIVSRNFKRLAPRSLIRVQAVWLGVVLIRYAFSSNDNSQTLVFCAIYMFAPLALWTVYSLVLTKRLSLNVVSNIGTIMTLAYIVRILAFKIFGLWIGTISTLLGEGTLDDTYRTQGYWVLLFLSMSLIGPFRYRKLLFAMAAVTVAALCMERSVQIGGLLGLVVLFAVEQKIEPRKREGLLCILILAVLAFSLIFYLNSQSIAERWSDIDNSQTAGSGRATFWLILIGTWWQGGTLAHIFGFGSLSVYATTGAEYLSSITHAHNEWLQMLYECGLVGLVSYAAMIVSLCTLCIRLLKLRAVGGPAVCFVTVVVLCHSFFDFFLSSTSALWYYVAIGAVLGADELSRNNAVVSERKHGA